MPGNPGRTRLSACAIGLCDEASRPGYPMQVRHQLTFKTNQNSVIRDLIGTLVQVRSHNSRSRARFAVMPP